MARVVLTCGQPQPTAADSPRRAHPLPAPRSAGSPAAGRARGRLLLVALHGGGVADLGRVGVLAGVTAGATLPEQVPALVELHLDGAQPLGLGHRQPLAHVRLLEVVLLVHQPADAGHDLFVVHPDPLFHGMPAYESSGLPARGEPLPAAGRAPVPSAMARRLAAAAIRSSAIWSATSAVGRLSSCARRKIVPSASATPRTLAASRSGE